MYKKKFLLIKEKAEEREKSHEYEIMSAYRRH